MTSVFSATPFQNDTGNGGFTFRNVVTPGTGGLAQVRATFISATSAGWNTNHCSIGIASGTSGDTTATPTELLFSSASGFSLAANSQIVSDWLNFTWTGGQSVVVIMDNGAAANNQDCNSPSIGTFINAFYKAATASYNVATVSGSAYTTFTAGTMGLLLLEAQGGGTTRTPTLTLMGVG